MRSTTMGNKVFALKVTSDQMPKLEGDAGVQIATQTIDETKLVSPFCERYRPIKRDAIVSQQEMWSGAPDQQVKREYIEQFSNLVD